MSNDKILPFKGKDPIQEAIKQLPADAGALYSPALLKRLQQIRQQDPAQFARIRQQAKASKVLSMNEFDRLTAIPEEEGAGGGSSLFKEIEPWPEPVDGAHLLDEISATLKRYVVADKETLNAAALWATFTWLVDVVSVCPIANITAPEKRCGKSVLLTALGKLAYRPLQVSNIATAALYRSIELWSPTLLIDEVDAFLAAHEDARGILNAGFTRDSAVVIRCVGDDHMPTAFNVWGAKALCGIGKIADTLSDRSIPLRMRRRTTGERVENLRHSDTALWQRLQSRLARFAQDNAAAISQARPEPIQGLNDRANDCWEPLLAIAEQAGGQWPKLARHAAIILHGLEGEAPSIGTELLADIKAIFDQKGTSKLFSADLLAALVEDEEAPWATWNRGKPISARQLSGKLSEFGVKSTTIRQGLDIKKGYSLDQFRDAFQRYLSSDTPATSVTPLQANNGAASSDIQSVTQGVPVTDKKSLQAPNGKGCNGVTDKTPPLPEEGKKGSVTEDDDGEYF